MDSRCKLYTRDLISLFLIGKPEATVGKRNDMRKKPHEDETSCGT